MTPSSLIEDLLEYMRVHAIPVACKQYRSRKNLYGRKLYNFYSFDYYGNKTTYLDVATEKGWDIRIHIRSDWGSLRVKCAFDVNPENAEWVNTPLDRVTLYKLARP